MNTTGSITRDLAALQRFEYENRPGRLKVASLLLATVAYWSILLVYFLIPHANDRYQGEEDVYIYSTGAIYIGIGVILSLYSLVQLGIRLTVTKPKNG